MGPWDPGPKLCLTRDLLSGSWTQTLWTQLTGPDCWDLLSRDPNKGSYIPEPIKRSEVRGPKYLHVNTVMNVHVSTKLTVGTYIRA